MVLVLLAALSCATDSVPSPQAASDAASVESEGDAALLEQLGYVDGLADENIDTSGVVVNDATRASQGFNFYTSRKDSGAQLLDMDGRVVHQWSGPEGSGWQHATLLPNGDVVVIEKNKRVFRVDRNSEVLWSRSGPFHHDLDILADGTVYVLGSRHTRRPLLRSNGVVVEDYIQVIRPDGKLGERISILDAFLESPYAFLVNRAEGLTARHYGETEDEDRAFDVTHANHIEVLDGRLESKNPAFAEGNFLISTRNTHTPIIYDPVAEEIVWLWGTTLLVYPHHPTVTDDGTVLVFNNGNESTRSQIVELDPSDGRIVWTHGPVDSFFSATRGSNQRLPNGNTLITESDSGYVFEVTPEGETVWEFRNPHLREREGETVRMAIWRMNRFEEGELDFEFQGPLPGDRQD